MVFLSAMEVDRVLTGTERQVSKKFCDEGSGATAGVGWRVGVIEWVTGVRTEGRSVVARMERSSLSVKVAGSRGEEATDGVETEEAMVD